MTDDAQDDEKDARQRSVWPGDGAANLRYETFRGLYFADRAWRDRQRRKRLARFLEDVHFHAL